MPVLFEPGLAGQVLERALARGGDFAELYAEQVHSLSISIEDQKAEKARSGLDIGAAVRVICGRSTYFGHVDGVGERDLLRLADSVASAVKGRRTQPQALGAERPMETQDVKTRPQEVGTGTKAQLLRECDERAHAAGSEIAQVTGLYSEAQQRVEVANSRGLLTSDERTRVRLTVQVIARGDGKVKTGREVVGGHAGLELLSDDPGPIGERAATKAIKLLDAVQAPVGKVPVVVASGFGGVLFHEATGHGLESDAVQKQASVYAGRRGERIASPLITAYDDGRYPGAWGTSGCDDEGTPTRRTCLIEEGSLSSYLYDLLHADRDGCPSTGNGRRQSFRHPPVPRMTNTYIAPMQATRDDLLAEVKRGVYAVSFAGGQVEPATGDFVFGLSEGYLIEDGEVTSPIEDATLVGNGLDVLQSIDGIADDLGIETGFCGKAGQSVPVGTGQPTVRIREMTVGGTGS